LDRPLRPGGPDAALDDELGPLIRIPRDDDDKKSATGMTLFAASEHAAELEERKRLLYVACTRAADYLLLSSSVESLDKLDGDWMELIADHFDLATGDYAGELPPEFKRPRVHIAPPTEVEFKPAGSTRGPDLLSMLADAHDLAATGQGIVPRHIGPVPADRAARRQFSFSRLSGKLVSTRIADEPGATAFASAQKAKPLLDARGLGSLVHDVLERINFQDANLNIEIANWCEHLAPQVVVQNVAEAAAAAKTMITRFAASPRAKDLAEAKSLHRETEFILAWPPQGVAGVERSEPPPRSRYITGKIDCLYEDAAGAWRIVDYKTNDVSPKDVDAVARQYEMQLYVYAMAAEKSLGVAPTELVLQFLRPGVEHVIPWNYPTRQRAIELVNGAIDAVIRNPEPTANLQP
jgi:ATP-dependent helicase/nuclease subunit A